MTGAPETRGHVDPHTQLRSQLTCFRISRAPAGGGLLQISPAPQSVGLVWAASTAQNSLLPAKLIMFDSIHKAPGVQRASVSLFSSVSPSSSVHPLGGARVTAHRQNVHPGHSSNCSSCHMGHPGWRNSLAPRQGRQSPPVASEIHLALFSHTR